MTPHLLALTTADGVCLAVHRLGPEVGVPVLLVPGMFTSHSFWLGTRGVGLARHLAAAGFHCHVLDLRGHGASERWRGQPWRFADWVRHDVPSALRACGGPAFVVGHSAGGAAVLAAMAADPATRDLVRGLVLLGTPFPVLAGRRWLLGALAVAASRLLGRFPARFLRLGPEDEVGGVMAEWMGWNLAGRWTGPRGEDWWSSLVGLDLPVLAMAGEGDRLWAPPERCRRLLWQIGSSSRTFVAVGRSTGFPSDLDHVGLVASAGAREHVWPRVGAWISERALS